jgi:hypothetical protein
MSNFTTAQVYERQDVREPWRNGVGTSIAIASVPVGSQYTFLLSKASKFVLCDVVNPETETAKSKCRQLNQ